MDNYRKYLSDIEKSIDVKKIWDLYKKKYPYAEDIEFSSITETLREIFEFE